MRNVVRSFLETGTLDSLVLGVSNGRFFEVSKLDDVVVVNVKEDFDEEFDFVLSISRELSNEEILALIMNVIG